MIPPEKTNPPYTFLECYLVAAAGNYAEATRMCDEIQMFHEDQVRASRAFYKQIRQTEMRLK